MQPQGLGDHPVQVRQPGHVVEGDRPFAEDLVQLGHDPGLDVGVAGELVQGPGQHRRGGLGARDGQGEDLGADLMPGQRLAGLLVDGAQQHGEHVPGVMPGGLQLVDGGVDGGAYAGPGPVEAAVEGQWQALGPVGQHDPHADVVQHHRQVSAQPAEDGVVEAAGEHRLGQHVEAEPDHRLAYVEGLPGLPAVDRGGHLGAHDVDVPADLGVGERWLHLAATAYVGPAGGSDDTVAQQLAQLVVESALVEGGPQGLEHLVDQGGVLDHDGARPGLQDDLDEWFPCLAQRVDEAEVVAHFQSVADERKRSCGSGYGGRRSGRHGSSPSRQSWGHGRPYDFPEPSQVQS